MKKLLFPMLLLPLVLWADIDTIFPCDDAGCDKYTPDANYGTLEGILVRAYDVSSNDWESYLGFNLVDISGMDVCSLFCYCYSGGGYTDGIIDSTGRFDEGTITWNTKPAKGVNLDTVSIILNSWHKWNVTQTAKNREGDTLWLNLYTSTQYPVADCFYSKEQPGDTLDPYIKVYTPSAPSVKVKLHRNGRAY